MLYEMNKKYFDTAEFYKHSQTSGMIQPSDYKFDDFAIFPVADPATSTEAQRLGRAQSLWQLLGKPGVNNHEIMLRWLDAIKAPNPKKILPDPDPNAPPPPEVLKLEAEIKQINTETGLKVAREDLEALKIELTQRDLALRTHIAAGELASKKVNSIVQIAEAENMGAPVAQAVPLERQEEVEAASQIPDETQPIAQQLGQITGQTPSPQQQQQQQQQGGQQDGQSPQEEQPIEEHLLGGGAPQNPILSSMQASSPDITGVTGIPASVQGRAAAIQSKVEQAGA